MIYNERRDKHLNHLYIALIACLYCTKRQRLHSISKSFMITMLHNSK